MVARCIAVVSAAAQLKFELAHDSSGFDFVKGGSSDHIHLNANLADFAHGASAKFVQDFVLVEYIGLGLDTQYTVVNSRRCRVALLVDRFQYFLPTGGMHSLLLYGIGSVDSRDSLRENESVDLPKFQ